MELVGISDDEQWQERAKCRGMDSGLFFPDGNEGVKAAKAFCQSCIVRSECLEHALTHKEEHGIWGGESERERGRMLRDRKRAAKILEIVQEAASSPEPAALEKAVTSPAPTTVTAPEMSDREQSLRSAAIDAMEFAET